MPNLNETNLDAKFDLILEKMDNLKLRYSEHADSDTEHFGEIKKNFEILTNKLDRILFHEDTGLVIRVDRLQESERKRSWLVKTAFGSAVTSIVASVWHFIKN